MKVPFIIYVDLETLLKKVSPCHNHPEKSTTEKNKLTFLIIHHLQIFRLMLQKANLIIIEENDV